jgi:predicted nucleic acid-binding protein
VDRLFLDANVLFSAAYRDNAGVATLWALKAIVLLSSTYAIDEAQRNLSSKKQIRRLHDLLGAIEIVNASTITPSARQGIILPDKDWPILAGAVAAGATHLITGDVKHFGQYFGEHLLGILVLPPARYIMDAIRTF